MAVITKYIKKGKQPYRCARCKDIIEIGKPRYAHVSMCHGHFNGSWSICISCDSAMAEEQIEENDRILAMHKED